MGFYQYKNNIIKMSNGIDHYIDTIKNAKYYIEMNYIKSPIIGSDEIQYDSNIGIKYFNNYLLIQEINGIDNDLEYLISQLDNYNLKKNKKEKQYQLIKREIIDFINKSI